jgi:outer membrane protein assembly factor BamD
MVIIDFMRIFTLITLLGTAFIFSGCATTPQDETYDWSAQKFYDEAKTATESENYLVALNRYSQLEAKFPYSKLTQQAQLETIYVHYRSGEPEAAIAAADRFIKLNPRHPNVDYAFYLKGVASYDLEGNTLEKWMGESRSERDPEKARQSFAYFKELITRYPDSQYVDDAIERMSNIRNSLATYEISVADYYLRRGAYLAAVNRAKYVIENYPKTTSINKALEIMAMGYEKLKMDDLGQDAIKVLQLNKK